jgi:hypothetical protein
MIQSNVGVSQYQPLTVADFQGADFQGADSLGGCAQEVSENLAEGLGGLPVRTDLRAGQATDDLGAQAAAFWAGEEEDFLQL